MSRLLVILPLMLWSPLIHVGPGCAGSTNSDPLIGCQPPPSDPVTSPIGCGWWHRTNKLKGLQVAVITEADDGWGAQLGGCNQVHAGYVVQAGVRNDGGIAQLGCWNEHLDDGVQLGLYNQGDKVDGVQVGLVNKAQDLQGVQLGCDNRAAGQETPLLNVVME